MKHRLFQYAILLHPETTTTKDKEKDKQTKEKTKLISDGIQTILAQDEKQAAMLVARAIPEEHIDNLNNVEVVVRGF